MLWFKFKIQKKQVSTDAGSTWVDVEPYETRRGARLGTFNTYEECMNALQEWFCSDDWYTTYIPDSNTKMTVSYRKIGRDLYDGFDFTGATDNSITNSNNELHEFPHDYMQPKRKVTIYNGVERIEDYAFQSYDAMDIELPSTLEYIGEAAFNSSNFKKIELPDSVTYLGNSAFEGSTVQEVKMSSGLTSVPGRCFYKCGGLDKLILPATINSISGASFFGGYTVDEIYCYNEVPPTMGSGVWYIPDTHIQKTKVNKLFVPYYSIEAYKTSGGFPATYVLPIENVEYNFMRSNTGWYTNGRPVDYAGLDNPDDYNVYLGSVPHDYMNTVTSVYFTGYSEFSFKVKKYDNTGNLTIFKLNASEMESANKYYTLSVKNKWRTVTFSNLIPTESYFFNIDLRPGTIGLNSGYGLIALPKSARDEVVLTYSDSQVYKKVCDSETVLTTASTKPTGYAYADMVDAKIGSCISEIGDYAFQNCTSLSSVTIPSTVDTIGDAAFYNCTGLTSIVIEATTPPTLSYLTFYGVSGCTVYVPSGCVSSYEEAEGWSNFNIQVIPEPDYKFVGTYYTADGDFKYKLECDDDPVLRNWDTQDENNTIPSAMTDAFVGSCVTIVGSNAFKGCGKLSSVTLSDSVQSIGDGIFSGCTNLTRINSDVDSVLNIPSGITEIPNYAFYNSYGFYRVNLSNNTYKIGRSAFGQTNLYYLTIPDSLYYVEVGAFAGTTWLSNYTANTDNQYDGIVYIGKTAYQKVTNQTRHTIKDGTVMIGENAFSQNSSLDLVDIPNSVYKIETYAFFQCSNLSDVLIGTNVLSIGDMAFANCTSLAHVNLYGSTPPVITNDTFYNCPNITFIYVPGDAVDTYKTASGWSNFANIIVARPGS